MMGVEPTRIGKNPDSSLANALGLEAECGLGQCEGETKCGDAQDSKEPRVVLENLSAQGSSSPMKLRLVELGR